MKNITSTLRRKLILSALVTVSLSLGTSMTSCSDWLEMDDGGDLVDPPAAVHFLQHLEAVRLGHHNIQQQRGNHRRNHVSGNEK